MSKNRPLPLRSAVWVNPLFFGEHATNELQKWLTTNQVEALKENAALAISVFRADANEPNFASQIDMLVRVAELADELGLILERAPATASAKLSQVFQQKFGDAGQKRVTAKNLRLLADGALEVMSAMPEQSRRKSPVFLVAQIAAVLSDTDIKSSVSENSRFFKICSIVFKATGLFQSPAAAIRVFMHHGDKSP